MVSIDFKSKLKKPMAMMLIITGSFLGCIVGYKIFIFFMMKQYFSQAQPPVSVTTLVADYDSWQPTLLASGSLTAIQGVDVTSEAAGLVRKVQFIPGSEVKVGDILVELNQEADRASLQALKAKAELAEVTYRRDKAQFQTQAISQSALDAGSADLKSKIAEVDAQAANLAKKTIVAPFSGRLGIAAVNEGQYVNAGDKMVTLQSLDSIYVDFYIPQQSLAKLKPGKKILIKTESYPDQVFEGSINAIDPKVNVVTRTVHVQATLSNPEKKLLPGMFVSVEMHVDTPKHYLTLPQTAISYNPYGEIVYVVTEKARNAKNEPILVAHQTFVTVGDKRGDQVAIVSGIEKNQQIVTSGQLKLKNGDEVVINNSVLPANNPDPEPIDE